MDQHFTHYLSRYGERVVESLNLAAHRISLCCRRAALNGGGRFASRRDSFRTVGVVLSFANVTAASSNIKVISCLDAAAVRPSFVAATAKQSTLKQNN